MISLTPSGTVFGGQATGAHAKSASLVAMPAGEFIRYMSSNGREGRIACLYQEWPSLRKSTRRSQTEDSRQDSPSPLRGHCLVGLALRSAGPQVGMSVDRECFARYVLWWVCVQVNCPHNSVFHCVYLLSACDVLDPATSPNGVNSSQSVLPSNNTVIAPTWHLACPPKTVPLGVREIIGY